MGCHVHYIIVHFPCFEPTHCCKVGPSKTKVKISKKAPVRSTHIHNIRRMNGEQNDGHGVTPAPVPAPLQGISQDKEVLLEDD